MKWVLENCGVEKEKVEEFKKKRKKIAQLYLSCEEAKIELSSQEEVFVVFFVIYLNLFL